VHHNALTYIAKSDITTNTRLMSWALTLQQYNT